MPLFKAKLDDYTLVEAAHQVLSSDPAIEPEAMTQAQFDDRRSNSNLPGIPKAANACERLGVSWPDLKRIALRPTTQKRRQSLAASRRRNPTRIKFENAVDAVRWVAAKLGQDTLQPHEYDKVYEQLQTNSRNRWKHGTPRPVLPSSNQIITGRGWDDVCVAAGLKIKKTTGRVSGASREAMIDAFINAFDAYPDREQLWTWVRGNGQSLSAERAGGESFTDVRARVIARRAAAGQTTPRCPPATKLLVKDGAPAPPVIGPPLGRNTWGTEDEIVEGLVLALDKLGPGENLTQKKLRDLSTGNPDIPAPSAVDRKGSLTELREKAVRLRASRMPS